MAGSINSFTQLNPVIPNHVFEITCCTSYKVNEGFVKKRNRYKIKEVASGKSNLFVNPGIHLLKVYCIINTTLSGPAFFILIR